MAEAPPFPDGAFDAVMAVLTIHHWSDPPAGLAEMCRDHWRFQSAATAQRDVGLLGLVAAQNRRFGRAVEDLAGLRPINLGGALV